MSHHHCTRRKSGGSGNATPVYDVTVAIDTNRRLDRVPVFSSENSRALFKAVVEVQIVDVTRGDSALPSQIERLNSGSSAANFCIQPVSGME